MGIEVSWLQPKRVLCERFDDADLVESMQAAQAAMVLELEQYEGPIHVIVDLSEMTKPPASLVQMRHGIRVPDLQKLGYVVFISGKSPVIRYFVSILAQVILKGKQFTSVDSLDKALQYLKERDELVMFEPIEREND